MGWLRRLFGGSDDGDAPADARASHQPPPPPPTLEQQIAILAQCGIRLRPSVTIEHLRKANEDASTEHDPAQSPFLMTVVVLGGELDDDAGERISDDIWNFDPECIGGDGSYTAIAERVRDLAQGELPIENITDDVDPEAGRAVLEFDLDGSHVRWELAADGDWADPQIFDRFAELLAARNATRRLTYLDLGCQDFLIGCATPKELMKLRELTGLRFRWMAGPACGR